MTTDYGKMKMPELRAIAKQYGIPTGRRKKVAVIEDVKVAAKAAVKLAPEVIDRVDIPGREQGGVQAINRIAELESQLAKLQPNGEQGGVGPNYWLWTHNHRKTKLIEEGMNPAQFGGNKDAEIAALQANDHRTNNTEPFPHPSLAVNVVEDYQPVLKPCTISPLNSMGSPINGARRIIDNAGNCIAAVYRQGKVVAGVETIMDMERNAQIVLEAFNGS